MDIKKFTVIDNESGEVLSGKDFKQQLEKTEAVKAQQRREYFNRLNKNKRFHSEVLDMMGQEFIQHHYENTIEICVDIKGRFDSAFAFRFIYLATFCDFDNILVEGKNKSKTRFLREKDLRDVMGLARKQFVEFKTKCFENGLLEKIEIDGNEAIRVNEHIVVRGKAPSYYKRNSTRISIPYIRDIYSRATNRQHKGLGNMIKLLPYVNYEYAILCHNPNQKYKECLKPLTLQDICVILQYDKTNASKLLRELRRMQLEEDYVMCTVIIGGMEVFYFNPKVFFKGTSEESLNWLKELFESSKQWSRCA